MRIAAGVRLYTTISAVIAVLAGCTVGPDYSRPEQSVGERFYQPAARGESFANLPWWNLFIDPVLQNLIRESLNENKDLKVAAARIEQARANLGFTRADQFPRIDLSGNADRTNESDNIDFPGKNPFNDFGTFGDLSFEIDIWGKLRRATEAERATLLSTEYAQRAIVISLVSEVATDYFHIVGVEDRLAITDETIRSRAASTNLIRARLKKGVAPEIDLNQAQIEEATARADRSDYERDLEQTKHAVSILLGKVPGDIPHGQNLFQQSLRGDLATGFPAELLQRRPDVMSAEEALRSETALIGVAKAERFPTLTLLGFVGLESNKTSDFFHHGSFTWSIGGSLLGPLVDFGKSKYAQEAQEASAKAALGNYEQTVIQAVREVDDALVAIRTSRASLAQQENAVKAAANADKLAHARYDEGVSPYLEVLIIERSLFGAQVEASNDQESYLTSIIQLYKSLGGGWKDQEQLSLNH